MVKNKSSLDSYLAKRERCIYRTHLDVVHTISQIEEMDLIK